MSHWGTVLSNVFLFFFIGGIPLIAAYKKIDVFGEFVDGAKDGFHVAVKIIPYLLAFIVAIFLFASDTSSIAVATSVLFGLATAGLVSSCFSCMRLKSLGLTLK